MTKISIQIKKFKDDHENNKTPLGRGSCNYCGRNIGTDSNWQFTLSSYYNVIIQTISLVVRQDFHLTFLEQSTQT